MTERQKRVYDLLCDGNRYSVLEITIKARVADPRSIIRFLREMGINVNDEWKEGKGTRYKLYWINQKEATNDK